MASLAIVGGIGLLIALIIFALKFATKSSFTTSSSSSSSSTSNKKDNKPLNRKVTLNPDADAKFILNSLKPTTTPLEILYTIATSPDNITVSSKSLELRADLVQRKLAHLETEAKKAADAQANATLDELLNDDDDDAWANDDEDDEAAMAAKAAKEEKKKQEAALAKATGKDAQDVTKVMLEGVDDDVLGMQWVKRNLTQLGVWPPPNYTTSDSTMDEPTERNLLMTMGRLNSRALNSHPELLAAGPTGKIDPTYFQSTMEFRQRVLQTLDNVLRMACTLRSYSLVCTILDAIVMFKIGLMDVTSAKEKEWFQKFMEGKYGGKEGVPRLVLDETYLGVPTAEPTKENNSGGDNKTEAEKKEEEKNKLAQMIAQSRQVTTSDDKMSLELQITRPHAESFTKEKLMMCKAQGIPPQIGMQAYRESWFIIVRAFKLNDEDGVSRVSDWDGKMGGSNPNHFEVLKENNHPIIQMLTADTMSSFEKEFVGPNVSDRKIVVGWPFVISNVAQKSGKVKIQLPPPDSPGKYEFSVTIKSQEFLCDAEEIKLIVDIAQGVKKKEDKEEDKESKKDK